MILFVIYTLGHGGAERVLVRIANYWAEQGRVVGILTFDKQPPKYEVHPNIRLIQADIAVSSSNPLAAVKNNLKRLWILRGWFKTLKPTTVISFTEDVNVLVSLAAIGRTFKLVVSDRIHPDWFRRGGMWLMLKKISYRFTDTLVVQTQDVKSAYSGFKVPIKVINNPLSPSAVSVMDYDKPVIIAVGRLDRQKNYPLLIEAFSQIKADNWTLQIFGEGDEKKRLQALITEQKLDNRVILRGTTKGIFDEMAQASVFVLSSLAEGYPNVLIEAMSVGLAVVSTNCPSGPSEIIRNGENGLIVPNNDAKALALALQTLVDDVQLRQKLGKEAVKISEKLTIDKIIQEWETLL